MEGFARLNDERPGIIWPRCLRGAAALAVPLSMFGPTMFLIFTVALNILFPAHVQVRSTHLQDGGFVATFSGLSALAGQARRFPASIQARFRACPSRDHRLPVA